MGIFPEQPTGECLSQMNSDIFDIASDGIHLALLIVADAIHRNPGYYDDELEKRCYNYQQDVEWGPLRCALEFLYQYADWRKISMPDAYKQAMEDMDEL